MKSGENMFTRSLLVGACALSTALLTFSSAPHSEAHDGRSGPKPPPRTTAQDVAPPDAQLPYVDALLDLIETSKLKGLAGIYTHEGDTDSIILWWKNGDVPEVAQQLISKWPIPVEIRSSPFSEAELNPIVDRLATTDTPFTKVSIGRLGSSTGIFIDVAKEDLGVAQEYVRTHVVGEVSGIKVPITVGIGTPATPASGRGDDSTPFYSGGYIDRRNKSSHSRPDCTLGFAVRANSDGHDVALTARHCGPSQVWVTPSDSLRVGTSGPGKEVPDVMLVGDSDKTFSPYMFDGQATYSGNFFSQDNRPVVSGRDPTANEEVCVSGAYDGIGCHIRVDGRLNRYTIYSNDPTRTMHGPGFFTEYSGSSAPSAGVAGRGDSGGPTFASTTANGSPAAAARGVILAVNGIDVGGSPCPGDPNNNNDRYCGFQVFSLNFRAALDATGTSLQRAPN